MNESPSRFTVASSGVSVIIPCFRAGEYIREAVSSITCQPIAIPYEIIIVDDGSSEEKTLNSLLDIEHEGLAQVIRLPENQGAQRARNTGLMAAQYGHIMMMDADDKLNTEPDVLQHGTYLDNAVSILSNDRNVAFVHGMTLMFNNFSGLTGSAYPLTEELVISKHHVPIFSVYRKEDAIAAGMYDEQIRKWQDWSFGVGLLDARKKSGY